MVIVGVLAVVIGQKSMQLYFEEQTQLKNRSIAMYVTQEYKLFADTINNGHIINILARQAMIINPIAEVYLLNPQGTVISHPFPANTLQTDQVDLKPIQEFLDGSTNFPLRSTDPKQPGSDVIFSASEVIQDAQLKGYFYVVLNASGSSSLFTPLSHIGKISLLSLSIVFILSLVAGGLIIRRLSARLESLSNTMCNFSHQELMPEEPTACDKKTVTGDEIDKLSAIFSGMAERIREQIQLLTESDQRRRELVSNISHDLRTPLVSVQGYLETLVLKNHSLSQEQRLAYLLTAEKGARRLSQLISDLFELSKLEAFDGQIKKEIFSLTELIYDTAQECQPEADKKSIQLVIKCPTNNIQANADISLIQRVFENLIGNAIQHTPRHGQITITLAPPTNQSIRITIDDTGPGINDEDLPFVFERYYQSPSQSGEFTSSTGLGLAIVKQALALHQSEIQVCNKAHSGAQFTFHLLSQ